MLLSQGELSVKDLTRILGQSQPRISRHLKLLAEAGLIGRVREGSWAYFHLGDDARMAWIGRMVSEAIDATDALIARDLARADALKREKVEAAQEFFKSHAGEWDRIRSLHVEEEKVEQAILDALGSGPFELLVDLGTGTGRMLELLAQRYSRAVGIDANQAMLSYARAKLDRGRLLKAQVRHGDIANLNLDDGAANAVIMHQVLHFMTDPAQALREAGRILAPGGRVMLVDFAPHDLDFLRETCAHVRLGIARSEMEQWLAEAGLDLVSCEDLAPPAGKGADKLTVSLWLAERRPDAKAKMRTRRREPAEGEAA